VTAQAAGVNGRRKRRLVANTFGVVTLLFSLFPLYWLVATSFKKTEEIRTETPVLAPIPPQFSNYSTAWHTDGFLTSLRNSIVVTAAAVIIGMAIAFFAAVALGRFWFRGRTLFIVALILIQMIPGEALFVPYLVIAQDLKIQGKMITLVLVYISFVLPLSIWMLRGFVRAVPKEIEEAALTDGATRAQAFRKVLFPLIAPGIVATSIFGFLSCWNEFVYAYTLTNQPSQYTVPVQILSFISPRGVDWGAVMAMSVIFTIPAVAFFLFVQRRAVGGLTAGAVKG
jgi:N,N'-diacetylchitobiose transport system permease protein